VWFIIAALVIALDQGSKFWVVSTFNYAEPYPVTAFFNLTLAHNSGSAFSFLAGHPSFARVFFIIVATLVSGVVLVWFQRTSDQEYLALAGLQLILGGAVGNLIDRIHLGYVIDFIHWHINDWSWPIFNVADSAICCGAVLILIDVLKNSKKS